MPFEYTPLPLLVIGALLIIGGAAWGPETKDVDFSEDVRATPADSDLSYLPARPEYGTGRGSHGQRFLRPARKRSALA